MLNVKVCDATRFNSSNTVRLIKITLQNITLINIKTHSGEIKRSEEVYF